MGRIPKVISESDGEVIVTVSARIPLRARKQIAVLARQEDRTLSGQIRRLLLQGLEQENAKNHGNLP